jgi:hypothetical protein
MAPTGQSALQGFESALPSGHPGVGGQAMFDEVEPSSRADDPSNLSQRHVRIGDRAQGEGAQGAVAAAVGKMDRLTVDAHLLDGDRRRGHPLPGEPEGCGRWLYGQDPLDVGWVELDVETRAESDLQKVSGQTRRYLGPPPP